MQDKILQSTDDKYYALHNFPRKIFRVHVPLNEQNE